MVGVARRRIGRSRALSQAFRRTEEAPQSCPCYEMVFRQTIPNYSGAPHPGTLPAGGESRLPIAMAFTAGLPVNH